MKKSLVIIMAIVAGTTLGASVARADSYGSAGCGLGSIVFQDSNDSKLKQVLAATTNGTFYSQSFGISFGTSNCDAGGGKSAALDVYIEANQVALATDVARGRGETLSSLSMILGCQDSATLGKALQSHYSEIFPSEAVNATQVSQAIRGVVHNNGRLASSCRAG